MPSPNQSATLPAAPQPNPSKADVPEAYANTVHAEVGNAEILLTFGTFQNSLTQIGITPRQRVILTHTDFVGIVQFLQTYADFLNTAYGNAPRNLDQVPQDQLREALKHIGITPPEQAGQPQEDSNDMVKGSDNEL